MWLCFAIKSPFYTIPHTIYTTYTSQHNTVQPIIGDAACGGDVRVNSTYGEVGIPNHFDCLPGAKIRQAINAITTTYPTHYCVWGLGLQALAPSS